MKEIMNNQEGETMLEQQEVMGGNSTADGKMNYENLVNDSQQANDVNQMDFGQVISKNQINYSQNKMYNQWGYVQGAPVNPALEAFYSIPLYQEANPYVVEEKKRIYTGLESAFAWISFVFGFFFCKVFPAHMNALGAFILVVVIFSVTTVVLKVKKVKLRGMSLVAAVSAVVVSLALITNSNPMLASLSNTYAMITYCYYVYASQGNQTKLGFNDFIVVDYFKALFVAPFHKAGRLFQGMFSGKIRKSGDIIGKVIKGGFIALIPTIVVCGLLSYDSDFSRMIGNMVDLDAGKVFSNVLCLGLGIIVGQYVFRLFVAASDNAVKDRCSEAECVENLKKIQRTHVATALAAVLPILFLYVVYFISQWKYYMSAFTGKLPSGLSYADYAREGFFQLCAVSVINMVIIVFVQMFMDVSKSVIAKVKSGIVITYAVFTLVLIATAISKMVLYIDTYGLTQRRVYSTWLMLVLAIIFVVAIIKQLVAKLNAVAMSVVVIVVSFGILALSNVDGFIARYNVYRYLEGSLETVDVWAMEELGDAAVTELVYLLEELENRGAVGTESYAYSIYNTTESILKDIALEYHNENRQAMSYTIPYIKAVGALEDAGLKNWFY